MMTRLMYEGKSDCVIGIVDNDQTRLFSEKLPFHVVYTDTNDIETMILWSDAFYTVARHLFKPSKTPNKQAIDDIRKKLVERAMPISEMRIIDKRNHWGLSFKDLNYGKFIKKANLDYEGDKKLIEKLKAVSQKPHVNEAVALEGLKNLRQEHHPAPMILVGHDLTKVIAHSLANCYGKSSTKDFDNEQVELFFRSSYSPEHFRRTQLRANIVEMMSWMKHEFI